MFENFLNNFSWYNPETLMKMDFDTGHVIETLKDFLFQLFHGRLLSFYYLVIMSKIKL